MTNEEYVKDFQLWIKESISEGHGEGFTADKWLETYLEFVGIIIAGNASPSLDEIVTEAKDE